MTEVVVGIEQLLALLQKEGISYIKEDPWDSGDLNYGHITTEHAIMTWRWLE